MLPHASAAGAGFIAPGAGAGILSSLARSAEAKAPEKATRATNARAREWRGSTVMIKESGKKKTARPFELRDGRAMKSHAGFRILGGQKFQEGVDRAELLLGFRLFAFVGGVVQGVERLREILHGTVNPLQFVGGQIF